MNLVQTRLGLRPFAVSTAFLAGGLALTSCMTTTSDTDSVGDPQGCPEFQTSGATVDANIKVDAKVQAFMQASANLRSMTEKVKVDVKNACVKIATELGAEDTWSAIGDKDDGIANTNRTGACDAARARIVAIMESDAGKRANFALVVSRGKCQADFQAQVDCEAKCSAQTKCDSGKIEERCQPGQLSVQCQDKCTAQSYCEGRVDVEANCEGKCEAECRGSCQGTCIDANGKISENDANCNGKCSGRCTGKCTGRCQVEASAGIACGASVKCKGSCTSTFTEPVCETTFTPPKCEIDQACFASCRTSTAAKAKCDPPQVKLACDTQTSSDVQKLVATINANLPPLFATAEEHGESVVQIGKDLVASGSAVLRASGDLDVKSLACATAAAQAAEHSAGTLQVAANAGAEVTESCSTHAK
ncbi:hypothetical protein LZC95_22355 [Pendulispora brunnea]|uniref:Tryptophan synthase alpha chain n=1 Tax=Pendulispora brunnea TaxID=2905690 RepID=A0ABZ2KPE7_9BACT